MKCLVVISLVFLIKQSTGVIYRLNASEHDRFPSIFHLDKYDACLREQDGLYCDVVIQLVSEPASELLNLIKDYSEHNRTHYDHSRLRYSLCVTKTCRKYLNTTEARVNIRATVEACVNDTLWSQYQLKARIDQNMTCSTARDNDIVLTTGDIVVAVLLFTIVGLNCVGSLYELYCMKRDIKNAQRNRLLMCFSVFSNWRRLVAPAAEGPEPRLKRLKGLNGIKTWSTIFVVLGHAPLPFILSVDNTYDFEEFYHNILYHILFNGMLIVQTFFIMSGFLLSFNILIYKEKHKLSLKQLPSFIFLRYLRLTPPYAVLIAVISTWFRFAGTGPMWKRAVQQEIQDCQNLWYMNLLYVNNYLNDTQCMAHTWYLAADMQLYVLGLVFCILMTNKLAQKIGLWVLFLLGVVIPGLHTYFQNLDGVVIVSPETAYAFFSIDPTFNEVYKRGHTNLAAFSTGLAMGYFVYHYLTHKFEETCKKFQNKRNITWICVPMILILFFCGAIFYLDGPQMPLIIRALYAAIMKPIFAINICIIILTVIFKSEKIYRGVCEWRGFTATARISYCAYLVHVMIIRGYAGTRTTMLHITLYQTLIVFFGILMMTFLTAVPLFLLVEAPFNKLVKLMTSPASKPNENFDRNVVPKTLEPNLEDNKSSDTAHRHDEKL